MCRTIGRNSSRIMSQIQQVISMFKNLKATNWSNSWSTGWSVGKKGVPLGTINHWFVLIRPYFLGGWPWGVPLGSHDFTSSANLIGSDLYSLFWSKRRHVTGKHPTTFSGDPSCTSFQLPGSRILRVPQKTPETNVVPPNDPWKAGTSYYQPLKKAQETPSSARNWKGPPRWWWCYRYWLETRFGTTFSKPQNATTNHHSPLVVGLL